MKAAYYTLGCKVNQYDTQLMREHLENAGYQTVPFSQSADVYVVNTCTVTQISDKKSRQITARAKRLNPDSILVICGCFAQVAPQAAAALKGADIILGTSNRKDILAYIERFLKDRKRIVDVDNCGTLEQEEIHTFAEKTRAVLKIEDGCENFCSYCLIPFARGKIRSKPLEIIKKEASALAKNGYREIVLTGIHLGSYGKEHGTPCLEKAICAVASVAGIERIRLGSLEPRIITPEFLKEIKEIPALCPHFHLSLQSGCDKTLRAMNRHYSAEDYRQAVRLLRATFEHCSITTDIIVGFPGETQADFEESLQFADEMKFAKIHIFPYSAREGTKAAKMPDQLTKSIKAERVKAMEEIEEKNRLDFWNKMIGTEQTIMPEEEKNGYFCGTTANYCPVRWKGTLSKSPVIIKITAADNEGLLGEEI